MKLIDLDSVDSGFYFITEEHIMYEAYNTWEADWYDKQPISVVENSCCLMFPQTIYGITFYTRKQLEDWIRRAYETMYCG